jgi:hypothetical protein
LAARTREVLKEEQMFSIEMLPAGNGDALWIEYGPEGADPPFRVLIDGGTAPTYDFIRAKIEALPKGTHRFELLVVTHVDADHIEGTVRLMQDESLQLELGDVWFNGWKHLQPDALGGPAGEVLGMLLEAKALPWNDRFHQKAVVVPAEGDLPWFDLEGGLRLTLLGPTRQELDRLRPVWDAQVRAQGMVPGVPKDAQDYLARTPRLQVPADLLGGLAATVGELAATPFAPDTSEPNGSSITLLAEFDGLAAVLAGDAHASVMKTGVQRLLLERSTDHLQIDAFKLPHHGSKHNVSGELVSLLPAARYLFSSNGARFGHPDPEAVARILTAGPGNPELNFNYRTEHNEVWDDRDLMQKHSFGVRYPDAGRLGLRVDL